MILLLSLLAVASEGVITLSELHYTVDVAGSLADVFVEQTYINHAPVPVDATYVFPLHEHAAVDDMQMVLVDRTIRSVILERGEAREAFERARKEGATAALTESERSNVFKQSIANIPPGAAITVELHLVQPVDRVDGVYELVLPMVVAPRFDLLGEADWNPAGTVPEDAATPGLRVSVDAMVQSGTGLRDVELAGYPEASIVEDGENLWARVEAISPHRDVVIRWRSQVDRPEAAFMVQGEHALVLFEAPRDPPREQEVARDLVWVIDRSGSMGGEPMALVKRSMVAAIRGMDERDGLSILSFADEVTGGGRAATATPLAKARGFAAVLGLRASGGTRLVEGVVAALRAPRNSGRERFVVFMTDGHVTVDRQVLAAVSDLRQEDHVFAFGVGAAPNRMLLDELARVGGGKVTWLRAGESPEEAIDRFLATIERPVLSDIEIDWGSWDATDVTPEILPTLFADQPLLITAAVDGAGEGPIVIRGRMGDRSFEQVIEPVVAGRAGARSVAVTWARQRIADLERSLFWGQVPEVEEEIIAMSLKHRVLSRFTAFVAIADDSVVEQLAEADATWRSEEPPWRLASQGGSGMVATESTQVGQVLTKEFLQAIPKGRSYEPVLLDAGVSCEGLGNPNISGGASNENTYVLDGATVTDPVTGTFGMNFSMTALGLGPQSLRGVAPENPYLPPERPRGLF